MPNLAARLADKLPVQLSPGPLPVILLGLRLRKSAQENADTLTTAMNVNKKFSCLTVRNFTFSTSICDTVTGKIFSLQEQENENLRPIIAPATTLRVTRDTAFLFVFTRTCLLSLGWTENPQYSHWK